MVTIYVVRHGRTEGNLKGILMGHIDTPLTDSGKKNVPNLAKRLKRFKFN